MPETPELRSIAEERAKRWLERSRKSHHDDVLAWLNDWLDGKNILHNSVGTRFRSLHFWHLRSYEEALLEGKARDAEALALSTRCLADDILMCVPIHRRLPKNPQTRPIDWWAWALAQTIAIGWQDRAELLARVGFDQIDGIFNRGITPYRFPWFLLELAKDWLGADVDLERETRTDRTPDLGFWEQFLRGWREPNPSTFGKLLTAAADFHVAQSADGVEDGDRVIVHEIEPSDYWLFPVLVFSVLRLREWQGLPNPDLDHPLFTISPLGRVPTPTPFPRDETLDAVAAKYREMFPATPSVEELPALRQKQGGTTLQ